MKHKRIILVGPTCSGKNYIREKFKEKGYSIDSSYTSRSPREGEKDGIDYFFLTKENFEKRIANKEFYEWVKYSDNYYGTGLWEWNNCEIFIMETDGISKIKSEDRKECVVIYINTPLDIRIKRMIENRGWHQEKILERIKIDAEKFKDFTDYDVQISSESE